ncbi:SNF1-related protein kinase regulatory subunit gamma 1 [Artemisia annua]|uniref:SNF1-related protein kinase regulatory subunit gamma 1 n=1 Tax=Artemisia annua TaxID=35608 RepID=A0A2U1PRM2_ARTAN|nr:SNF1-related protein kinase regulatory subunit gamma 1 [Artemisia annua]
MCNYFVCYLSDQAYTNFCPVIEINSDASLGEAVRLMSQNKVLSAPVVDVDAPQDASWIDRYLGMVEFAGIVVWILHQAEKSGGLDALEGSMRPAVAAAASGLSSPRYRSSLPESPKTAGNFFEILTSSDFYKNTKYRMKSVPVVDPGEQKIDNIITQSAVIHMLEECADLQWFKSLGSKKLCDLGLPLMKADKVIKVDEDEPVLQAFRLMREKRVGGLPVVSGGNKPVANISIRDSQFLLIAPEIYKDHRSITAMNFVTSVKRYLEKNQKASPIISGMVTCRKDDTLIDVISKLDSKEIHRIYVVDEEGNLEGVITLRDIISRIVHEPRGYFGDFFDGVLPLPANSRV